MYSKLYSNFSIIWWNFARLVGVAIVLAFAAGGPVSARDLPAPGATQGMRAPSDADLALLQEINAARADPRAYAQMLRADLTHYRGRLLEAPGREPLMTEEGVAALEDAIADLERRTPAPPLRPDSAVATAALRLVADEGASGRIGHVSSDGSTLRDRFHAAGVRGVTMEEDIAYGPRDPSEVVRELIVDDGVPDRGHRTAIFDANMDRAGSACGPHATWRWMCVIDFAGALTHPIARNNLGR